MGYDPDLDPILAAIHARLDALEARDGVPSTPAPKPDPEPAPAPDKAIWELVQGTRVSIPDEVLALPGAREIYIPVTADRVERQSFYCFIDRMVNMTGGGINVGNDYAMRQRFGGLDVIYRWSPGDDPTHYVKVMPQHSYEDGKAVKVSISLVGLGDGQKGKQVVIRFTKDAQPLDMPPQFHRPLRHLDLSKAKRKNTFNPATLKHSDSGFDKDGKPCWRSRLAHGYSQGGNGETGLYANDEKFPNPAVSDAYNYPVAQNPISYDAGEKALRLHTFAYDKPAVFDRDAFNHQAAVIQGQTMDDVCGVEGVWRMEAKIPSRRYSWPAFWLIGRGVAGSGKTWGMWPPEIDILEKFNKSWGADDTNFTTTFAQHYGDAGSDNRKGAFGGLVEVDQWTGAGKLQEGYHSWACAVVYDPKDTTKSEVTFFFDDVEVGCHVLFARHQDLSKRVPFMPIANVAVRAPSNYTAKQYNTDDGRGLSGDMLVRDIAYYPEGFAFA